MIRFLAILFLCAPITACTSFFANDSRIEKKKSELITSTTFNLIDNRIVFNAFIDHEGPFKFMFDTGSANVMTTEVARKLKLNIKDQKTTVDQIQIGQLVFIRQEFQITDLASLDGAFGYQALEEYIVSINFSDNTLSLNPTFKEGMREDFQFVPIQLVHNKPVINAKINGQNVKVLIDTSDRSGLTVFKKSAAKSSLELHSQIQLKDVPTKLGSKAKNLALPQDIAAVVGNEVLKQFDLIFDYRRKFIYFKKHNEVLEKPISDN